ncbi:MAG: O-antigen ligase family protein [Verrucomicrobiota bacterium]
MLPLFLGGATEVWAYGATFALIGLILVLSPPEYSLSKKLNWAFVLMALSAALAFLPASWIGLSDWRKTASEDLGIDIPGTVAVQPWVSFHCLLILIFILFWMYFLASKNWPYEERLKILKATALVIFVFAAILVLVSLIGIHLPTWNAVKGYGPFENRNQTGSVLAMGGVLMAVCAYAEFRKHKFQASFWIAGIGLVFLALLINQSRGGILFFFAGLAIWIGLTSFVRKSPIRVSIAASLLLVAVTVFFLSGGEMLERLAVLRGQNISSAIQQEGRIDIYQDTMSLVRQAPLLGVGLGNFAPAFARFRENSQQWERALHPESDWLWHVSETGLVGLAATLMLLSLLVYKVAPLSKKKNLRGSQLRIGALACALTLTLNALVDVPAHRLGSILPALLFLSLAIHHRRGRRRRNSNLKACFRGAGAAMVLVGSLWLLGSTLGWTIPGPIGSNNLYAKAVQANLDGDYSSAHQLLTKAIQYRPLRWEYYFLRGKVAAQGAATLEEARNDFRIARFLEPTHAEIPHREALFWLSQYPPYALPAIHEAVQRNTHRVQEYYASIIKRCLNNEAMLTALGRISDNRPDLKSTYLERIPAHLFQREVEHILSTDPDLHSYNKASKGELFEVWSRRGNKEELMIGLAQKPSWQEAGWELLADFYARNGDTQAAIVTALEHLTPPVLPQLYSTGSLDSQRAAFYANLDNPDPAMGLRIYHMEKAQGNIQDAFIFLEKVTEMPDCPPYAFYILAQHLNEEGQYEAAWRNLKRFLNSSSP